MGHLAEVEERERLLLTVVEAAAMLGVGRTKAYELIAGGELQVVHIGRSARVPLVAVRRYVDGLVSPPRRTISLVRHGHRHRRPGPGREELPAAASDSQHGRR